jgi:euchromatic histone-lysine N-methyltransferase
MVYVYDGLYRVVEASFVPGKCGHDICMFRLLRLPGQVELGSKSWHTAQQLKETMDARIHLPLEFEYLDCPEFPVPVKQQRGSHCGPGCSSKCRCRRKNSGGGRVYYRDGTLVMGRPVVYECGALCRCPMTCINRVT